MKEFVMIFHGGDYESGEMSPEEMGRRLHLWNEWIAELRTQDLFLDGRALKNQQHEVRGEGLPVTDGPFVEMKELVTGYIVVKANDLDHVRELSQSYPDYDIGGRVEIREIQNFE